MNDTGLLKEQVTQVNVSEYAFEIENDLAMKTYWDRT